MPKPAFATARQCAEYLLTTGDEHPFLMRTFQYAMEFYGFPDRMEAGREFRRLVDEGRIIKAGECGLAFLYKVQEATPCQ